jgi:hypothetical protein
VEVKKKRSALEMQCFQGLRVSESTLTEKGGDEEADEVQGDMDGCTAEERNCGRGRGSVWYPLELLRVTVLEKRKKGIVNRLRNAEGVLIGLILVDSS